MSMSVAGCQLSVAGCQLLVVSWLSLTDENPEYAGWAEFSAA